MLKIKDDVDLKELENYGIKAVYKCNEATGKVFIEELTTSIFRFERLRFRKNKKIIGKRYLLPNYSWCLKLNEKTDRCIDLDTLYDLIKANLVEKVED